MYKHIITYRYYIDLTATSSISAVKKIEIIADERIHHDGPGIWKTKCKNFISTKTGINPSQVLDDSNFRIDYVGNSQSEIKSNNSSQDNSGSGLRNLASDVGTGAGGAISGTLSGVGNLAGKGFDALNKELDKGVEDNKKKRKAIEDKADEISKIEFGSSKEDIQSQMEQLISYGNTLSSEQNPIKKAVYSKVTFGIMRLKTLGANDTASFFENESKKIKPNLWNAIWFWATFSNT